MKYTEIINSRISRALELQKRMLNSPGIAAVIENCVEALLHCYREHGGRVFFAGNGGSAADAQHLAAELVGRFYRNRAALSAEALTVNSSALTAIANDYGFDSPFARILEGNGRKGDVLAALSTSGNSPNIVKALQTAQSMGIVTIGFTGEQAGKMDEFCDILLKIPEADTPRIQEGHILAGHIICEIVEREMFPDA
ncbi:MAG: phosphoheptose isomerase [Spirochaeta sp. LUC14_002_19_P3]|nr:MAG: phosphoheptose isomerase [Spirochaeta sp. LUC14_002_19_P3]